MLWISSFFRLLSFLCILSSAIEIAFSAWQGDKPRNTFSSTSQTDKQTDDLLIHTLNGELLLVHRPTGVVNWTLKLDPALQVTYNRGPILITDPIDARLYEYSSDASDDLFTHLDHSIMGYVRRSPAYYKNFISFGSKNDFWMTLNLRTGTLVRASDNDSSDQCPGQVSTTSVEDLENVETSLLGLGRTQYNLLFRDPAVGTPRLNITFNTFASQTDPELQNFDLHHVATNQPSLLTFQGRKLLWSLPLSSPVVGLYTVREPSNSAGLRNCKSSTHNAYSASENGPTVSNGSQEDTTAREQKVPRFNEEECDSPKPAITTPVLHVLRRIAFTTYALDIPDTFSVHPNLMRSYLQAKFNGSLELVLSMHVAKSDDAPLYAIPCVTESTIPLRSIRRTPDQFLLEGPDMASESPANPYLNWDDWSLGLVGLYELPPTQLSRWSSRNEVPLWARLPRLRQITDKNTGWGVILPPIAVGGAGDTHDRIKLITGSNNADHMNQVYFSDFAVVPVICVFLVCLLVWIFRNRSPPCNTNFLPPTFDVPQADGWAGCSAEEAGQPEDIRFNVTHVLGSGANGTMVFAGIFGQHKTAVKRIVRQPHLEKHWRREHTILLHHHHPNLVRCFWTGSTANFHYLVMQRCDGSLSDLLKDGTGDGLVEWGLTPTRIIHQILLGVACLHQNGIVHRDLKPSNILLVARGTHARVVVGDFGLSRPLTMNRQELTNSLGAHLFIGCTSSAANTVGKHGSAVAYTDSTTDRRILNDLASSDQTSVGMAYGTLGWMAPELCLPDHGPLTRAVDIFSCGLLAYHVLTYGGHPYDCSNEVLPEKSSTGSKGEVSVNGSGSFPQAATASLSGSGSEGCGGLSYHSAARLSRHHARQLAIVENRQPTLERLSEQSSDISSGFLSRHLIQAMLSQLPAQRPTAEEVIHHPLFWSPNKVIHFIADLSDILDTREDLLRGARQTGHSNSIADAQQFLPQRVALLEDIEASSPWVFNEHWFYRLEFELVEDLLSTRGYQDTSLMDLLRAIRNKRNHIWHLREHIRELMGRTQEGMASYWTSRFPSLLPLLYDLGRIHLTGCSGFSEYLPPPGVGRIPSLSDVLCDWWRANSRGQDVGNKENYAEKIIELEEGLRKKLFSSDQPVRRRQFSNAPWKRGEVVVSAAESVTTLNSNASSETVLEDCTPINVPPVLDGEALSDESVTASTNSKPRQRKRPNHPKKIRPSKKKSDRYQQLATAGCELQTQST